MDKFSAMRAFVRVAEAGSFTRAAETLGVPKAQVTRQVQALEQELRTLLLNRTTRRVTVTAEGAAYYERAVSVLDDVDELESTLSNAKVNPRGRLRIDVPSPAANLVLLPALHEFCERYPEIQLDIGVGDRPVDLVAEKVDCAIRVGEVSDPSLVARRIGEVHRVACASPAYLKKYGMPAHPSELEHGEHRLITYFSHGGERPPIAMKRGDERYEFQPRPDIAVNDSSAMLAAALAGLGIARTAGFMATPYVAAGSLQIVLPEWSAGVSPLYLVYPPNRHVPARLRVFIDWTVELFECALQKRLRGEKLERPTFHKELVL